MKFFKRTIRVIAGSAASSQKKFLKTSALKFDCGFGYEVVW
jgi:hypothetical protein